MKIHVFDDWFSVGHLILGFLALITPLAFTIFLLYELVEFCLKYPHEKASNFVGDIFEFILGLGFAYLIVRTLI